MNKMLLKLKEQERRLVKEQLSQIHEQIKLSPKIDIENCIKNGYITAEDYRKSHQ